MTKLFISKSKSGLAQGTAIALVVIAAALATSASMAQSPTPTSTPFTKEFVEKLKVAFTAALTRSSHDASFRRRLLSLTDAKPAVQEEGRKKIPDLQLPEKLVVIFYEPELDSQSLATGGNMSPEVQKFFGGRENQNYHVFYLPKFDPNDTSEHKYKDCLMCCYRVW